MIRIIAARLVDLGFVLIGISLLVFCMIRFIPGDAVAIMLGANTEVTPDRVAALRSQLGLDQPLLVQYGRWAWAALHGDLGTSLWTGRPVVAEIALHIWPTVQLTVLALLLGAGLSVPAGCLMARLRGGTADTLLRLGSVAGLTIPSFWLGIVMILALATLAPSLQLLGYVSFFDDPIGNIARLLLPAICLALPILANLSRLVRSALLESLGQDYIRTARAKGLARRTVVLAHAWPNALLPVVTVMGLEIGRMLAGAVVVETLFGIPGMGRLIVQAVFQHDFPIVQGCVLVMASAVLLVNFATDLVYAWLDPRIRYDG